MPLLRSNKEIHTADRPAARRHAPGTAQKQAEESAQAARARNARYLKKAREYQLATGDSADTLREKRRWVQAEFQAGRISGKPCRELRDLYSKRNITKRQKKRAKVDDLTDDAKEIKRRLDDAFAQAPRPVADAGDGSPGAVSDNAGEMSSSRAILCDGTHTNRHLALQETQNPSEGGSSVPKAAVTAAVPGPYDANTAADAAAIERSRLPGLPLRIRWPATSADGGGEDLGSAGDNSGEDVDMEGTEDADVRGH